MTINEVNQNLKIVIKSYLDSLETYSDEKFYAKKDEDTWSLGQMYEHLILSANAFFLANTTRCLEKRKGQIGGEKNKYGENAYQYGGFPPVKVKIPEGLPKVELIPKNQESYKVLLEKILLDSDKKVEEISHDTGDYKTLHPVLGWLNAYEWLYNMEMHFRHHLRQKAELEA
jgi:hypothetical protein